MENSNAWNKEKAIEKLLEIVEKGSNHERLAAIRQLNLLLGLNTSQQLENAEQLDGKILIELVNSKEDKNHESCECDKLPDKFENIKNTLNQ